MNKIAGLYIHIPFCARKCTYCNFNTTDFVEGLAARYCQAVAAEIHYWGQRLAKEESSLLPIDTIYFGGGTPSIVEAEQLATILAACRRHFQVTADAEITIEINPATLSPQKLTAWLAAGINRASVGIQSFLDSELIALSRTHDSQQALQTIAALRAAGFQNISLDLIAGLPQQTKTNWQYNLHEALLLRPEHLSLYLLEVKEGTQLFSQIKRGQRPQPDDDLAAQLYEMMCAATAEAGYEQYEISNFALASRAPKKSLRSKHNLKYWSDTPFYGMGCGAHSYDGRMRWVNTLPTETYVEQVAAQGQAIHERRRLDDTERATEAIFMALRLTEGIDLAAFRDEYGMDILATYGAELERSADAELITIEAGRLRLTARGRLLSNEVFMIFV
ncbi:MAG: radical SAM family heme chaperone HemW [Acidobacteria bacterium]|nr:radical SAM family heme chaperone HemW [Acidobacteriota bacterium]